MVFLANLFERGKALSRRLGLPEFQVERSVRLLNLSFAYKNFAFHHYYCIMPALGNSYSLLSIRLTGAAGFAFASAFSTAVTICGSLIVNARRLTITA